ncbi:esterase family protein [Marinilongibacter aquaticus]|uniref:alpha/beta hydrolase n=1 Tax=Marinilongibacter aquaticus TaxID=2975157 RepID=UPI0021BD4010|nr:alpha/beta hydrolase-fold protein [Marinilongibacter aquaticus]UBM57330.1 esterase family protein [Marinilongibacter aquaticus]
MRSLLFILFCALPFVGQSQSGKVLENMQVHSEILNMDRNYAVYLPPGYETSERNYPVLYLLHGATDNHTGWVQFGEVLHITDKAIQDGLATPMIIIMPDADTKVMGYFNVPNWNYEDFFFKELMPHVEQKFRIRKEKRYRAVAGLSMGGGGSFMYALRHPELFSSACPLSAYVGPLTEEQSLSGLKRRFPEATEAQAKAYFENYNALNLLEKADAEQVKSIKWYIDCGDDDFLYEGNALMHIAMRKKNIPHEYRVRNGGHTWTYWREALPTVLGFVTETFHQH